jgi:hypothetical protein
MILSEREHVWNASKFRREEINWVPTSCYEEVRAEAAVTCCTLAG